MHHQKSMFAAIDVAFGAVATIGVAFTEEEKSSDNIGQRAARSFHEFGHLTSPAKVKAAFRKVKK